MEKNQINIPDFHPSEIPQYSPYQIQMIISQMKTNKSTLPEDIPAKVMKRFSVFFSVSLADIINTCLKTGAWPASYKIELITPIAKITPPEKIENLRPISNLPICDKITEKVISEMVISDMKSTMDPKQFGNQKNLSIQHYLVDMMHNILSSLDNNRKGKIAAVLWCFVDWKSAFSNQCHKLGIESFIRNGVKNVSFPYLSVISRDAR